ncbi:MAG: hypothetical protein JKX73_08575, partial [Flavobacteriales bacterium]|nr:hypothetical protein [Flavobacteriales bacterium]
MKKLPLLAGILLTLSLSTQAQFQNLRLGQNVFTLSSVDIRMGVEIDTYRNMSPEWMKDHTKNPSDIDFDASSFTTTSHAHVSGMSLGGHMSFTNPRVTEGKKHTYRELRFGAHAIVGGEALVTFTETDERTDSTYTKSLMYCLVDNEIRVGADYKIKSSWGRINAFVGIGAQLGGTLNSEMLVFNSEFVSENVEEGEIDDDAWMGPDMETMDVETFEAKSSLYLRAYVPFGVSLRLCERTEIGLEHRLGIGV